MWYGSEVSRHGSARPFRSYQLSSRRLKLRRKAGAALARRSLGARACPPEPRRARACPPEPWRRWVLRILAAMKIYTRTGDAGGTALFGGTPGLEGGSARRRVRRCRRAERVPWRRPCAERARRRCRRPARTAAERLVCHRRPARRSGRENRGARHESRGDRCRRPAARRVDRSVRGRAAAAAAIHSAGRQSRRRAAALFEDRLPPRGAIDCRARHRECRSAPAGVHQSPVRPPLRRSRASSIIGRASRKSSGSCPEQCQHRFSRSRLTASKTFRASS